MMMVCNIFGFGEMWPKFGGARLPNGQRGFQKSIVNAALKCDRKRHECRLVRRSFRYGWVPDKPWSVVGAVGPAITTFAGPSFPTVARDSGPTAARLPSQRLGAFRGFGQMQGQHPSKVSGKARSRSGASPHQSSGGASPLMTNTKTFVPYFKSSMVSL